MGRSRERRKEDEVPLRDRARTCFRTYRKRAENRWYDLRAFLAGYCNDCPHDAIPGEGGGYPNWRCALRRGHDGQHRFRNYVWDGDDRVDYQPAPVRPGQMPPSQPWERHMTLTRRQERAVKRWDEEQRARILARAGHL